MTIIGQLIIMVLMIAITAFCFFAEAWIAGAFTAAIAIFSLAFVLKSVLEICRSTPK